MLADGGFDIDKVERVEIEWVDFIREKPPTDAVREFAEHVAEDTRRRESAAWTAAARQAVDDCERRMKELEDEYVEMCCTFQRLLCELSGGKLSKPNVEYGEMVSAIDEEYERIYNEEYKELRDRIAELKAERDRWRKKSEMLECYIEGPQGWRASCAELEKAVIALYICATDGDCDDCPLNDAHPVKGFRLLCDGIGQLLDGLGIEVD